MLGARSILVAAVTALLSCAASSAAAAPFTPTLDEFWIIKNGQEIFRDAFTDGVRPPSGPDGVDTYVVRGADGMTSEAGGKLVMTPVLGEAVLITTTFADLSTSGVRRLATNPANAAFLGPDSAFEIHGLYDLSSLPTVTGQSFGIRATDRAPVLGNEGDNVYALFVGVGPTGERRLGLRLNDFTTGTSTVIESFSIESLLLGADQIEFILTKALNSDLLTASYRLFDYDLAGDPEIASASIGSGSELRIYEGETYTRAEFLTTDRIAVPEPGTVPLLGLGIAGLVLSRRRRGSAG